MYLGGVAPRDAVSGGGRSSRRAAQLELQIAARRREKELREHPPPQALYANNSLVYRSHIERVRLSRSLHADQVRLPIAALDALISNNVLSASDGREPAAPTVYHLSSGVYETHAVVAEYATGADGSTAEVSPAVWRRLGLAREGGSFPADGTAAPRGLTATCVELPRGTAVTFALEAGGAEEQPPAPGCKGGALPPPLEAPPPHLADIEDLPAFLEAVLKAYTTLSVGDVVPLEVADEDERPLVLPGAAAGGAPCPSFVVRAVEPPDCGAILIRDTDIEARIESPPTTASAHPLRIFEMAARCSLPLNIPARVNLHPRLFFGEDGRCLRLAVDAGGGGLAAAAAAADVTAYIGFYPLGSVSENAFHFARSAGEPAVISAADFAAAVLGEQGAADGRSPVIPLGQRPKCLYVLFATDGGEGGGDGGLAGEGNGVVNFEVTAVAEPPAAAAATGPRAPPAGEPARSPPISAAPAHGAASDGQLSPPSQACAHCRRPIAAQALFVHEAQCRRRFATCDVCRAVVARAALAEHTHCAKCGEGVGSAAELRRHHDAVHADLLCGWCGAKIPGGREGLLAHTGGGDCAGRLVRCRFCKLFHRPGGGRGGVSAEGAAAPAAAPPAPGAAIGPDGGCGLDAALRLSAHERRCGARTQRCALCDRFVELKRTEVHLALEHGFAGEWAAADGNRCFICGRVPEGDFVEHVQTHL